MTTKHTCGGPVFGKKTPGCPRCDELIAGEPPTKWKRGLANYQAERIAEIRNHDCKKAGCGPICTFGDW
jgi:hypothetical protein